LRFGGPLADDNDATGADSASCVMSTPMTGLINRLNI